MLEEVALPYEVIKVDITNGDQFSPEFLAVNPNGKIPAIVDREGFGGRAMSVFESGAILIYLAEKTGKLLPSEAVARLPVIEWLLFQMSALAQMFGQANLSPLFARELFLYETEGLEREAARLYTVLDGRLGTTEYLAGDYSIADIASYPWIARHEWQGIALDDFPNVRRWFTSIASRPAVQRGMQVPKL